MDLDVIDLVSSDEEGNDGELKEKTLSSKSLTIKRVKVPLKLCKNAAQKTTPPQNNNNKITVIHGYKSQLPIVIPQKSQTKDGNALDGHKTVNISPKSGITITRIRDTGNSHANLATTNTSSTTAKTKPDAVTIASKINQIIISPSKKVTPNTSAQSSLLRPAKRINPTKVSDSVMIRASSMEKSSDSDMLSRDSLSAANDETVLPMANGTKEPQKGDKQSENNSRRKIDPKQKTVIHDDYKLLIETCSSVDPSEDMKKIVTKLEKYYQRAHPKYVNSKSFLKLVKSVVDEIKANPKLLYIKVNTLLLELRTRRVVENVSVEGEANDEPEVDEKTEQRITQLSKALQKAKRYIRKYEEAEVDWNDEGNSMYMIAERYKQRACAIYEKLCDLTGESRTAERIVKKPIKFTGTKYPQFNRKLEKFVNETKSFPDMFDVLRIMDHCNKNYDYRMNKEDRKRIATLAFHDVGSLLQKRRKSDLYEMVQYFEANQTDPAGEDPHLKMKLDESQRHYAKKMKEVIEKYASRHANDPDHDEQSAVKNDIGNSMAGKKLPKASANARPTTTPAPPRPTKMEMDLDISLNDTSNNEMIIGDDGDLNDISKEDAILNDEEMQELQNELFPTITSVTSLHPNFNEIINFDSNPLETSNIL